MMSDAMVIRVIAVLVLGTAWMLLVVPWIAYGVGRSFAMGLLKGRLEFVNKYGKEVKRGKTKIEKTRTDKSVRQAVGGR